MTQTVVQGTAESDSVIANSKPSDLAKKKTTPKFLDFLFHWFLRNYWYFICFAVPALLTFIAYCIFGIAPFGEESVLCLDLNGQYVYFYEALRDAVWDSDKSVFYNWSRNLSGEFIGTIGYYLASPFMWIIILLPEKWMLKSILLMQLAKVGTSGVTISYYLQKSKKISGSQSLPFAMMYAMMAYVMIQLIDPMWIDGVYLLPLIMLGVEYLVDYGKKLNFIIPLAMMFTYHFYIGFMVGIFTFLYFLYYMFCGTLQRNRSAKRVFTTLINTALAAITAVLCAATMILSMRYALSLGKFDFTDPDYSFKFQFDLVGFFRQLLVDQYDSVNVWGSPEIYCGVFTVVLIPLFFMNKKIDRRRKAGYIWLMLVMFFCMAIKPVDMMWHGGQSPNWLPYRYSFVFTFILISMAAESLKHLDGVKVSKLIGIFCGYIVIYIIDYVIVRKNGIKIDTTGILRSNTSSTEYLVTSATGSDMNPKGFLNGLFSFSYTGIDLRGSLILSMALAAVYLILIYMRYGGAFDTLKEKSKKVLSVILSILMVGFCGFELTYNAVKEFKDIDDEVAYSTKKSWNNYIENGRKVTEKLYNTDPSLYRCEKTFYRCINDNMAFGLRGLSHSTSVMNAKILKFLEAMGYASRSYYSRYDGNTPISDSLLGIKYVMDRDDDKKLNKDDYQPTFTYSYTDENKADKTITVYENPDALSIGYMVDSSVERISALGNDNPFNSQNIFLSSLCGETNFETGDGSIGAHTEYYKEFQPDEDPIINNITVSDYGDQKCYTAEKNGGDPTIDYHITVSEKSPIYFYFRTDNEKSVNLWSGVWNDSTQDYDFEYLSTYFENEQYCVMRLGTYEPGTKICLRMTVANDYTIFRDSHFVYFQEDIYQQAIDKLSKNQWNIDVNKFNGRYLTGKVTAGDNQIMLTSIPSEKGWTVKVDGKKVKPVTIVDALIAVPMSAGEHTVTMKYTPPYWWTGQICLLIGIILCVIFGLYDKKHREEYIKEYTKCLPVKKEDDPKKNPEPKKGKNSKESENIVKDVMKEKYGDTKKPKSQTIYDQQHKKKKKK